MADRLVIDCVADQCLDGPVSAWGGFIEVLPYVVVVRCGHQVINVLIPERFEPCAFAGCSWQSAMVTSQQSPTKPCGGRYENGPPAKKSPIHRS